MSKKLQKELCLTIRLLKNVNLVMEYMQMIFRVYITQSELKAYQTMK